MTLALTLATFLVAAPVRAGTADPDCAPERLSKLDPKDVLREACAALEAAEEAHREAELGALELFLEAGRRDMARMESVRGVSARTSLVSSVAGAFKAAKGSGWPTRRCGDAELLFLLEWQAPVDDPFELLPSAKLGLLHVADLERAESVTLFFGAKSGKPLRPLQSISLGARDYHVAWTTAPATTLTVTRTRPADKSFGASASIALAELYRRQAALARKPPLRPLSLGLDKDLRAAQDALGRHYLLWDAATLREEPIDWRLLAPAAVVTKRPGAPLSEEFAVEGKRYRLRWDRRSVAAEPSLEP